MKFFSPIDIRFRDLDALAHVNNVVYLTYVEQARVRYFDALFGNRHDWNKRGVLLARTEINYLQPLFFKEDAKCGIECVAIGNKSLEFHFVIFKMKDGKEIEVASGLNVLVCFDHEGNKSIPVPEEWKIAIENFEEIE
jgi:acyl-CoA thioester hydrolase